MRAASGPEQAASVFRVEWVGLRPVNARQLEPAQVSGLWSSFPRRTPRPFRTGREARASVAGGAAELACLRANRSLLSGGGGIRTLGTLARTTVFETAPFNHSGTPPGASIIGTCGGRALRTGRRRRGGCRCPPAAAGGRA